MKPPFSPSTKTRIIDFFAQLVVAAIFLGIILVFSSNASIPSPKTSNTPNSSSGHSPDSDWVGYGGYFHQD